MKQYERTIAAEDMRSEPTFVGIESTGRGDGSVWELNRDTAERDLTAFELLTILNITLTLGDGFMGALKDQPHLLRHFRRVPPT